MMNFINNGRGEGSSKSSSPLKETQKVTPA